MRPLAFQVATESEVSPSGKMQNRSDVYRRALIKLDEMREAGMPQEEYDAGRQALAQVAISNAS